MGSPRRNARGNDVPLIFELFAALGEIGGKGGNRTLDPGIMSAVL
jgi:hypothetical protein